MRSSGLGMLAGAVILLSRSAAAQTIQPTTMITIRTGAAIAPSVTARNFDSIPTTMPKELPWTRIIPITPDKPIPRYMTKQTPTGPPPTPTNRPRPGWWGNIPWICEDYSQYWTKDIKSGRCHARQFGNYELALILNAEKIMGILSDGFDRESAYDKYGINKPIKAWAKDGTCVEGRLRETCEPENPDLAMQPEWTPGWECSMRPECKPDPHTLDTQECNWMRVSDRPWRECWLRGSMDPKIYAKIDSCRWDPDEQGHFHVNCDPIDKFIPELSRYAYQAVPQKAWVYPEDRLSPEQLAKLTPNPYKPTEEQLREYYIPRQMRCFPVGEATSLGYRKPMDEDASREAAKIHCALAKQRYGEKNGRILFQKSAMRNVVNDNEGWDSFVFSDGRDYAEISVRQSFGVQSNCTRNFYPISYNACVNWFMETSTECSLSSEKGTGISLTDGCIVTEVESRYLDGNNKRS